MKRRNVECFVLILAVLLSLASVSAFAAPATEESALLMENVTVNDFDSTYYNDGGVVINNFGIVYNNGGTVYNNGGTVYNNEGTVYNNGGIVFNNGAEVYNNGGTVYNNDGGIVHETGLVAHESQPPVEEAAAQKDVHPPVEEQNEAETTVPVIENPQPPAEAAAVEVEALPEDAQASEEEEKDESSGLYVIELDGDYSALALIEGLTELPDGSFVIRKGAEASIRAKDGLILTHAITTTGSCSSDNMGTITLANVDRDGRLTLKFKAKAPHASLASGSYDDEKYLSLSAEAAGAKVLYTTDNNSAPQKGKEAMGALKIEKSMLIRAVTVMEGAADSEIIELVYVFPEVEEPSFKSVKAGYSPVAEKPAVLINTGLDTVYVESVRLGGENADCFTLSTEKGGRIASGQRDDSTWMIAPVEGLDPGEYEAEVIFTFASGDRISEDFEFTVRK